MPKATYPEKIKQKFISIMRNHAMAKYGDVVANFLYSTAKTKVSGTPTGVHVLDKSLAEAIREVDLRQIMPSSSSAGNIGDGAEALVGYAYLQKIMSIDEMIAILVEYLQNELADEEQRREREIMTSAFILLLEEMKTRIIREIS